MRIIFVLLAFVLLFTSCEKSNLEGDNKKENALLETPIHPSQFDSFDEYIAAKIERNRELGKVYTVEHLTREEIDKVLIENGFDPIVEDSDMKMRSPSRSGDCDFLEVVADWNHDYTINTLDLLAAASYICNHPLSGGCAINGGSIIHTLDKYEQGLITEEALNFGTASWWIYNTQTYTLNHFDLTTVQDFILGKLDCQ